MSLSNRFFAPGRNFLGVDLPIICGAMTWVSDPKLVGTVCNAGGFGCLAAGNMSPDLLKQQIQELRQLTDHPFAVNLITISPSYTEHLKLAAQLELPFIVFAGSFPRERDVAQAKKSGAKVLCFASTLSIARRMINAGADGLILEGMEAGGHVGHVSLVILLQQVLFELGSEIPVFVAGGLSSGQICAHMFLMGAAGVQMGTRFAVAEESCAHEKFKRAFIRARAREAVSTPQFDSRLPVVAVRALRNHGLEDFARLQLDLIQKLDAGEIHRQEAQLEVERFWMGALRRAVIEGDIEDGSMMAGQSVGLVDRVMPVAEIMTELQNDIETELQNVRNKLV